MIFALLTVFFGICATILIGQEMLCFRHAGFFLHFNPGDNLHLCNFILSEILPTLTFIFFAVNYSYVYIFFNKKKRKEIICDISSCVISFVTKPLLFYLIYFDINFISS